jgi:ATP-dependent DNA helicase RecG
MTLSQLKALTKKGESEKLEFKRSTAQIQSAMQTIGAFLNSESGGTVLIGVTDDGKIVEQIVSDSTRKEIASELHKIEPHVNLNIEYIPLTDKKRSVIKITTEKGNLAPYVYDGRPFMRSQSTTQRHAPRKIYKHATQQNKPDCCMGWPNYK